MPASDLAPDMVQLIAILPVALTDWGNTQADAMGNNGPAFGLVLLSPTGAAPSTHSICNVRVTPAVLDAITAVAATQPDLRLVVGDDVHWLDVIAALGLSVISGEENPA